METIVVYSPYSSARLTYVLGWLMKERLQLEYKIVHSIEEAAAHRNILYYGVAVTDGFCIPDTGLLQQTGLQASTPETGSRGNIPVLYPNDDKGYTLPFDILSAVFYLLSRYEEYQPFVPDKHGRYPATESILFKNGWLQRPIVDEWVYALRKELISRLGITVPELQFVYKPTYDIDMAYSHLHKGVGRIAGAYLRALLTADLKQINLRTQVLKKKQKDPFDSFRWLRQLHKEYGFIPTYFVLAARRTTKFDKNIHPEHPAMVRVIKNLVKEGRIGIHPSYYSTEEGVLQAEHALLEKVAETGTTISRQHYIKAVQPHTYRQLLGHNITEDYSMGYGTHLGFRAGTGCSFLWYDVAQEQATTLRVYPFCFMDTTAHYEAKLTTQQSFERLERMCKQLEETGSMLITVFHNFSLGTDDEWKGWRQAYELFLHARAKRMVYEQGVIR
jgi:hypothetical protein